MQARRNNKQVCSSRVSASVRLLLEKVRERLAEKTGEKVTITEVVVKAIVNLAKKEKIGQNGRA